MNRTIQYDFQILVPRHFLRYFGLNLLFDRANNMTLGMLCTDAQPGPWALRNAVQPLPKFFRDMWSLSMGIDKWPAVVGNYLLYTVEGPALTWFIPVWSGKKNWLPDFQLQDMNSSWEKLSDEHLSKLRRGILQLPQNQEAAAYELQKTQLSPTARFTAGLGLVVGYRLLARDVEDFYSEMIQGGLADGLPLRRLAQLSIERADPQLFATLPEIEKRYVLVNLALLTKAASQLPKTWPLGGPAQRALAGHLPELGVHTGAELQQLSVENLVDRINNIVY
jgi:hypothetical protein